MDLPVHHCKKSCTPFNLIKGLCIGCVLSLLYGCSPLQMVNVLTPDGAEKVQRNIAYGMKARQQLDIYLPAQPDEDSPVLVFFYGGSWRSGARGDYQFVAQSLALGGYTTVIPDYRTYPEVRFPVFMEDGAMAVAWVLDNIGKPEEGVILIGHSAGAHLASLLALDPQYLQAYDVNTTHIKGVIGLAGPYAFDPLAYRKTRPIFSGLADVDNSKPITHACGNNLPLLLLHGEDDGLVVPENSLQLHRAREQCGMDSTYIELEKVGHFDILLGLSASFADRAPVLEPIQHFIGSLR